MIAAHDEPVATATWLSHFQLCEQASRAGFGSLFGGLGGDELNAGEYEHFFFHFADLKRKGLDQQLAHEIACWVRHHDHPVFRKSAQLVARELERIVDWSVPGRCLPDCRRIGRYAAALAPDYFDLRAYRPVMDRVFTSYLKNRTWQDLLRETAPCCLRAEDRQASAFGLDHYLPFFDYRLVEFMFRVPGRLKIQDGVTKQLLRRATVGILPDSTRTRIKKTGWNAPAHVWFSGRGADPLRDLIRSRSFRERGVYELREVERLLAEHQEIVTTGRLAENHMMFLWQLVNLELWLRAIPEITAPPAQVPLAA
jgi:asparagine synthase (glutamine-hydrolysing)